jgi:hypothetical protein
MPQHKLDFVIGGSQKAGTCTLDSLFRQHPQIQMATVKETHFFDDEERDWNAPDYSALDALFSSRDNRLRGEATPITIYWKPATPRLYNYNPDIKIILSLRNPITRAFSNWQLEYCRGNEKLPFSEAIRGGRSRVRTETASGGLHRFFAYVERGLYGDQLSYLCNHISKRSIHCEIYEEFFCNRPAGLERIATFLNIDSFPATIPEIHLNPAQAFRYPSPLTKEDVDYLSDLFRDQIGRVEEFIGRPIPSWRSATEPE